MSRRATRPFDQAAMAAANAAVYDLTKPPGRKLDPHSPEDALLRKKWMDAYADAGGKVETVSTNKGGGTSLVVPCPKKNFIELLYLHCDESPVKNAQYHIRSRAYNADGQLNASGFIHIDGVPDASDLEFYFDKDPEEYKPRGPEAPAIAGKKEAESTLGSVGNWIWGTVEGDFNQDQSVSQITVNMVLGFIPIVDQVLDIRDLIAGVKNLIVYYMEEEEEQQKHEPFLGLSYETWLWLGVFLIAIGCIPELGSAVKGVLKVILRKMQDSLKALHEFTPAQIRRVWEECLKVLNYLGVKQGNAHTWLKALPGKLDGLMQDAGDKIKAALKACEDMAARAEDYARKARGILISSETAEAVIQRAKRTREAIGKAYRRLEEMKTRLNEWIREQLKKVIEGASPEVKPGSINEPAPHNSHIQEKAPPPEVNLPHEVRAPERSAVADANFAQSKINKAEKFSKEGQEKYSKMAGRKIETVDDLAAAIEDGTIKPSQLPVDYVVQPDGTKLILNTRTSVALDRANVPKSEWYGLNKTGMEVPGANGVTFNDLARDQLERNGLPATGSPDIPKGGSK